VFFSRPPRLSLATQSLSRLNPNFNDQQFPSDSNHLDQLAHGLKKTPLPFPPRWKEPKQAGLRPLSAHAALLLGKHTFEEISIRRCQVFVFFTSGFPHIKNIDYKYIYDTYNTASTCWGQSPCLVALKAFPSRASCM